MSPVFAERPRFFEGQFLGADDLDAFLRYSREQDARHMLGAHTWGIVTGIELASSTDPGGTLEYFLTPGIAIDGYGRLIVVNAPYKLITDPFASLPTGRVDVWLRFVESPFSGMRPGFQVCDCSDAFARVQESFVIEVGPRNTVTQRESDLVVGDETFTDAREAPAWQLPKQPLACDGSVPAQTFPGEDARSLWLIPVCQVPWNQATGEFSAATETDQKMSRRFRRQAGLVTEHIYPAGGVIRMRPRWSARQAGIANDQVCAASAIKETDLIMCDGDLTFRELIWLEGNARFTGDARLYGRRLEFQETNGTDYLANGVPLALRRRSDRSEVNGVDLQVLLGKPQGADGPTRLTIGAAAVQGADPCAVDFTFTPGVFVQHDGKAGIGTTNSLLTLPLTIRAAGANGDLVGFQSAAGPIAWQINFGPNKNGLNFTETNAAETRVFIETGGNVGIGTLDPEAKLDVRGVPAPQGNALGGNKWFQLGDGGDGGRFWVQYGDQLAPLVVLSDFDDPSRIQFQQIGTGQETGPQFSSWIGHARGGSSDLALMGGSVGVGTLTPFRRLHVEASEIHSSGALAGFSFGNREDGSVEAPASGERWVWYATGRVARLWSGGDKLGVTSAGSFGIGTTTPAERLDVRGSVKLGANGDFFGVGCLDNHRMVAGRVDENGGVLSGTGYTVVRLSRGRYRVSFNTPFSATPVVLVTLVDPLAEDNLVCVVGSSSAGFTVVSLDYVVSNDADPQDSGFNFMALGPRA